MSESQRKVSAISQYVMDLLPGNCEFGLREELIRKGALHEESPGMFRLTQDVAFSNANAAAGVINGKMASGPNRWVVRGRGTPLKDLPIKCSSRKGVQRALSYDVHRWLRQKTIKILLDNIFEAMYKSTSSLQGFSGVNDPGFVADYKV